MPVGRAVSPWSRRRGAAGKAPLLQGVRARGEGSTWLITGHGAGAKALRAGLRARPGRARARRPWGRGAGEQRAGPRGPEGEERKGGGEAGHSTLGGTFPPVPRKPRLCTRLPEMRGGRKAAGSHPRVTCPRSSAQIPLPTTSCCPGDHGTSRPLLRSPARPSHKMMHEASPPWIPPKPCAFLCRSEAEVGEACDQLRGQGPRQTPGAVEPGPGGVAAPGRRVRPPRGHGAAGETPAPVPGCAWC